MVRARGEPKIRAMAKADPRETTDRPGPVRTSSGTRIAARRAPLESVESDVVAPRSANDVNEMPTRELDLEQLRAMALRCASDVGSAERTHPASPIPGAREGSRPRLELVLADEAPPSSGDADRDERAVHRSRRSGVLAFVVVIVVLAAAAVAACEVYGLPL